MTVPRLSVVVPTRERRDSVLRLLRALHAQTAPPSAFEVVVAADGTSDDTVQAVSGHASPFALRTIAQSHRGLAATRNAGARAASGNVVLFLDDDMEPAPALVAGHLARHDAPDVLGVVGAAPIVVPPDASPIVRYRARGFARKLDRLATRPDGLAFNDVYGGNFSLRRSTLLSAGGYDERFVAYGHEDYELAMRLARAGGRFVYSPGALAHQYYGKTLRGLAADVESEGRTAVLFARAHPEVLSSLGLGRFRDRSRRAQLRLAATIALSRVIPNLADRLVAAVERRERDAARLDDTALFARYDRLFDALYWIGAERALRGRGIPWWRLAVRDVPRWLGPRA